MWEKLFGRRTGGEKALRPGDPGHPLGRDGRSVETAVAAKQTPPARSETAIPAEKTARKPEAAATAMPSFTPNDFTALFVQAPESADSLASFFNKLEGRKDDDSVKELREKVVRGVQAVVKKYQEGRLKIIPLRPDPSGKRKIHDRSETALDITEQIIAIGKDMYALSKKVETNPSQTREIAAALQTHLNKTTRVRAFTSEYFEKEGIKAPPEKIMHSVSVIWPGVAFEHDKMQYEGAGGVRTMGGMFPAEGRVKEPMGWLVYQAADQVTPYTDGSVRVEEGTRWLTRRAPVG